MRAVVNRVKYAKVFVDQKEIDQIGFGLLVYLGITHTDNFQTADKLINKLKNLRIFEDSEEKMNLNLADVNGQIMIISQFTLYGETKKNNRPSFTLAASPAYALPLYEYIIKQLSVNYQVGSGQFGSHMQVVLENDGPVNILIELD